jgi:hypothetical protein
MTAGERARARLCGGVHTIADHDPTKS